MSKMLGLMVAVLVVFFIDMAMAQSPSGATAEIRDEKGGHIGSVMFLPKAGGGTSVRVAVWNVSPGLHGFHVHETGLCEVKTGEGAFASAGKHLNPGGHKHGQHAGDLPNLEVGQDGTGQAVFQADGLAFATLFKEGGTALILHASRDDGSDPAGNAGARIGCGVVKAAPPPKKSAQR